MTKKQLIKIYGKTILNLTENELITLLDITLETTYKKQKIELNKKIKRNYFPPFIVNGEQYAAWECLEFVFFIIDSEDDTKEKYSVKIYRNFDINITSKHGNSISILNISKYLETIKRMVENEN